MRIDKICDNGADRLILIFLGWGMEADPLRNLNKEGYDITAVSDYRDIDDGAELSRLSHSIERYGEIVVAGWSFGVRMAAEFLADHSRNLKITKRIAINGTPEHIDDARGIPTAIFQGTLANLNEQNIRKFRRRMFTDATTFANFNSYPTTRTFEQLKEELERFGQRKPIEAGSKHFDLAIIGEKDAIFPWGNQKESRGKRAADIYPEMGHYPDFQQIIDKEIVDKALVTQRFADSAATYRANATVQQEVARKLWEKVSTSALKALEHGGKTIEIGAGKGILTELYADDERIKELELWDIAPLDKATAPKKATLRQCDAESAIREEKDESISLILSTSTIQWFNNPTEFVRQSVRKLRTGGVMGISSFSNANFQELRALTGHGLRYPSMQEMIAAAEAEGGEIVTALEERHTMTFENGRELLKHLKSTGVNAIKSSNGSREGAMQLMRTKHEVKLTYAPIYLIIKK